MIDLTKEQWAEFYGITFDSRGNQESIPGWKPDFSKWYALWDADEDCWFISPKVFYDNNKCIPDHCITFEVPGFYEGMEHALMSENLTFYEEQEQQLIDLGFKLGNV